MHLDLILSGRELNEARQHHEDTVERVRGVCDHIEVFETPFKSAGILFSSQPPRRMCVSCGLEEDGWGCGYGKLAESKIVKTITDRWDFYGERP